MPGGDGTGPRGAGSMTGRGAGFCAGFNAPGYTNPVQGQGFMGRGCGRGGGGRGWRNWFHATGLPGWMRFGAGVQDASAAPSSDAIYNTLQAQAEMLQQQLDAIKNRLNMLATGRLVPAASETDSSTK